VLLAGFASDELDDELDEVEEDASDDFDFDFFSEEDLELFAALLEARVLDELELPESESKSRPEVL